MAENLVERELLIDTGEGAMGTYVVHPAADGPYPHVVFLMDAPGKRPLLHAMARRIASEGYFVTLPNLYYRATPAFELEWGNDASLARMAELMYGLGNAMVARDVGCLLSFADANPAAEDGPVGVVGYCMSGPFALWSAAEHSDRVAAVASFYGVRLHVAKSDSPHLRLGEIGAEMYVACAEFDDWVPLDMVDRFEEAMEEADVDGRLERYWGMHHGFAFNDRPAHDPEGERRHWDALFDLFGRNLRTSDT